MSARQTKVVEIAKSHIGSSAWGRFVVRKSEDGKVQFNIGEPKCNLFVYEMLTAGGVGQELPNKAGFLGGIFNQLKDRPYTASQWHKGEVPKMKLVGSGVDGLNKS